MVGYVLFAIFVFGTVGLGAMCVAYTRKAVMVGRTYTHLSKEDRCQLAIASMHLEQAERALATVAWRDNNPGHPVPHELLREIQITNTRARNALRNLQ